MSSASMALVRTMLGGTAALQLLPALAHVHTEGKTTIVRLKIDCKEQDSMEWDFLIPPYEECHVSPVDGVMSGPSWIKPSIDDC